MTQSDHILAALKRGEALTGLQILQQYGCMNFRDVMWKLRKEGHAVKTDLIKTPSGKRIALYSMPRKAKQTEMKFR